MYDAVETKIEDAPSVLNVMATSTLHTDRRTDDLR